MSRPGPLTGGKRSVVRGTFAGVAIALMTLGAQAPAQVSLKTVVDLAQKNSTGVRAAQADVSKAAAVLSESKDAVIPSLTVGTGLPVFPEVGFTGQPPSLWNATVQALVYSIPQKRYIDAARFGVQAASERLKDAREQVALDASSAYIELDAITMELNSERQQEQSSARLVEIAQQRVEAGVDPTSELLQAKLTAAQIKLKRLHLEARATVLEKQLAILTGLPDRSIQIDHASIPEIPQVSGELARSLSGTRAAQLTGMSKMQQARGDREVTFLPDLRFFMQYNRNTTILNNVDDYFLIPLPANNLASGISVQIPIFDMGRRAKAKESAADALRARVEAEQAEKQNDIAIAELSGSIRELDTQAEIASLKQQIADDQLRTVLTQLEAGNGSGSGPGARPQVSPKAEQLARIDAGQKTEDALDAGFELAKARLNLLRALGHMDDWLHELKTK